MMGCASGRPSGDSAGEMSGRRLPVGIEQLPVGPEKTIGDLIDIRHDLRAAKLYQVADHVRTKLDEAGVVIEDGPKGTTWKLKR